MKSASLDTLPQSSLRRLYNPESRGNSFSLDGFPSVNEGENWLSRLEEIIQAQGPLGMTTNQTLFRQLVDGGELDERMRSLKQDGKSARQIYWLLYNEAATTAAGAFGEIHAQWSWEGRVSQEASALLMEADPLLADVRRIAAAMAQVGAFTKIPNLPVGPEVIQAAVADAESVVSPNITLVFSDLHYLRMAQGYLMGLSKRIKTLKSSGVSDEAIREKISEVHSVNSVFVSRVDRVVDPMIDKQLGITRSESDQATLRLLKGKSAIAQAKKIFQMFETIFLGVPFTDPEGLYADSQGKEMVKTLEELRGIFKELKAYGAHPQRVLIASSGTKKEQPYSPLLYVLPLMGPWTANTLPEKTLMSLSRFVENLSDETVQMLQTRSLIKEKIPAIPTDVEPTDQWDQAIFQTSQERQAAGVTEWSADQVLAQLNRLVFKPEGTSLRAICDTLRDKGAESFTQDEEKTLQIIQDKLASL